MPVINRHKLQQRRWEGGGGLADRTDKYWISFQIHAVIIFEGFEKKRVFAFG